MFNLEINGKTTEIKCGVRFLKEINKRYTFEVEGISLGFGVSKVAMEMEFGNIDVLIDLIESSTRHIRNGYKPTTEDIENFLDEQEDYEWLLELFTKELSESLQTKKSFNEIHQAVPQEAPKAKAKITKPSTKK